mgnify:FL=1
MTNREYIFFVFFLPLFALKLLNITSGNLILTVTAGVSFIFVLGEMLRDRFQVDFAKMIFSLLLFTALLVFTSGKTGVFFSSVFLVALKGINPNRHIYKYSFTFGCLILLLACYLGRNGDVVERFVAGEWTSMTKRSNLLYVSFAAVLSLYLLKNRQIISYKHIIGLFVVNYAMFLFVGSRTGCICILLLLLLLICFKTSYGKKNRIIYLCCVCAPFFSFLFSIITGVLYGKYPIIDYLDISFQGRIYQEYMYFNRYPITLLGQPLYEGDKVDFWNLDCAYWDMLLNLGLIFTCIWLYISTKAICFFYKRRQYIEVSILVMYSVYGISETFLPNCFLNMSFFLYAEWLYYKYGKCRNLPS